MIDPETTTVRCHLLSIPTELRVLILSYILPRTSRVTTRRPNVWIRGSTSILRTCKQLHVEGVEIIYSRSPFAIDVAQFSIKFDAQYLWVLTRSIRRHYCIFPQCFGEQYLHLIKTLVVKVRIVSKHPARATYNHSNPAAFLDDYRAQVEHLCTVLERLPHLKRLAIWFRDDSRTQHSNDIVLQPLLRFITARISNSSGLSGQNDQRVAEVLPELIRRPRYRQFYQADVCFDIMSN